MRSRNNKWYTISDDTHKLMAEPHFFLHVSSMFRESVCNEASCLLLIISYIVAIKGNRAVVITPKVSILTFQFEFMVNRTFIVYDSQCYIYISALIILPFKTACIWNHHWDIKLTMATLDVEDIWCTDFYFHCY